MSPRPKHSGDRTTQGDAWARSVGSPIPRKRIAGTQRWFHGTNVVLRPGDRVVPGATADRRNWDYGGIDNDAFVWLHDNAEAAGRYGQFVYEVVPIGWVENYSEQAGHDLATTEQEYIAEAAIVVRRTLSAKVAGPAEEYVEIYRGVALGLDTLFPEDRHVLCAQSEAAGGLVDEG